MRCAHCPHMRIHGVPTACPRGYTAADGIYVPLNRNVEFFVAAHLLAMLVQTISSYEDHAFTAPCFKFKSGKGQLEQDQVVLEKAITRSELYSCGSSTEVGDGHVTLHLLEELECEGAKCVGGVHEA